VSVVVKYNHLPRVIKALPREVDRAVDKTGNEGAEIARQLAPVRSGILVGTTEGKDRGRLHAEIWSGVYRGHGFYAGFVEFGANQPGGHAQPYMIPTAHLLERVLVRNVTDAVKDACDV